MPNMTPEEARPLLDRLQQAGNVDDPVYAEAADAIIPMLETIAGMRWEYAVLADGLLLYLDHQTERGTIRQHWGTYGEALYLTERFASWNPQILRRLVSQPEEVKPCANGQRKTTMTKTLADMSTDERANCVGMWCEVDGQLEILAEPYGMVDYHDTAIMHSVKRNGGSYVLANAITPRFDLPRAWTPDGAPVGAAREAMEEQA